MTALHDPTTKLQPQIVDLAGFRRAATARDRVTAAPAGADAPPVDTVVVQFADAARRLRPHGAPATGADGFELLPACEHLVTSFRTMHEAVIELVVSCRELETAPARKPASTEDVMLGLAILSTATERFQQQLAATIDSAFR
ncbi:MAG: hypothetical protein HY060_19560 [Proteobacteria bacterium]|nr:hypothetical protein [Pseudomonadota bacterium]